MCLPGTDVAADQPCLAIGIDSATAIALLSTGAGMTDVFSKGGPACNTVRSWSEIAEAAGAQLSSCGSARRQR